MGNILIKSTETAPQRVPVSNSGPLRIINIYLPPGMQRRVRHLVKIVEESYPSAKVCLVPNEVVGVNSVGFDVNPVFQLQLHRCVENAVKQPRLLAKVLEVWDDLLDWVGFPMIPLVKLLLHPIYQHYWLRFVYTGKQPPKWLGIRFSEPPKPKAKP